MIGRVVRAVLGQSRRMAEMDAEMARHKESHDIAMMAAGMKVEAIQKAAEQLTQESAQIESAAARLMDRLQDDLE